MNTITINLFGGPGSGKSTTAAGLFSLMKLRRLECELVTEFAKELTWERREAALTCQPYMLGTQLMRHHRVTGQVDFLITDSPLLLSSIYAPENFPQGFHEYVWWEHRRRPSVNVLVRRVKPYNPRGRNQTQDEATAIHTRIANMLDLYGVEYFDVDGDEAAPLAILRAIDALKRMGRV